MSVNWSWKNKMGEFVDSYDQTANLYEANCLAAIIYEWKETDEETKEVKNMYQFGGFWNDKEHLERCVGLRKRYEGIKENMYSDCKAIRLNTYYKSSMDIAQCFARAKMPNFKIELYYEEPAKEENNTTGKTYNSIINSRLFTAKELKL